jgi:hypothetical protein
VPSRQVINIHNNMKTIKIIINNISCKILSFLILVSISIYSNFLLGQLPKEFPDKWKNKVICGEIKTTGKMISGSMAFLTFPYKLTVSDAGIYAEYNLDEKFGRDDWGQTQTINTFEEYKRVPTYNRWNDPSSGIGGYVINYKVPNAYKNSQGEFDGNHSIVELTLDTYVNKSKSSILSIFLSGGAFDKASITSGNPNASVCGNILSADELKIQEEKRVKEVKIAAEAAEKVKKENEQQDVSTTQNINSYISNGRIEMAAQEYSKLHFQNNDLKKQIQSLLNDFFADSKTNVTEKNLDIILNKNRAEFSKLGSGKYSLIIEKNGNVMLGFKTLGSAYSGLESTYNEMYGFKCLSSQSTEIVIEVKEKKLFENDSVRYFVSEKNKKKDIYLSKKGDYFLGWFAAPLNAEKITKPSFYDENLKGNNIVFLQLYLTTKTFNGKLIDEKRIYKTEKIITPKKAIGRKIFRIITSPLWILFVDFNSI